MFGLLNEILECTEFVSQNVTSNLVGITETWDKCSRVYAGVVEKINLTWRVPLDTELLEEFPDIKTKVVKKLEWLADKQLLVLRTLIERVFNLNECLRVKLDRINNRLERISFAEHADLKHTVGEHVMWIEDCWTCLHCLYMQIDFAMISLGVVDEKSAANLVDAIKQEENDKLIIDKSKTYMQSCSSLIKFLENKSKIKIDL